MFQFFEFVANSFNALANLLTQYRFNLGGISVSIFGILLGGVCISIIISLFWKGGRG